jgi:hypothetical protein
MAYGSDDLEGTMRETIFAIGFLMAVGSAEASTGTDVNTLIAAYDAADPEHQQAFLQFVKAEEQALLFANSYLAAKNQKLLYCPTLQETFDAAQLLEMMRHAVQNDEAIGKMPMAMGLLITLVKSRPCPADR